VSDSGKRERGGGEKPNGSKESSEEKGSREEKEEVSSRMNKSPAKSGAFLLLANTPSTNHPLEVPPHASLKSQVSRRVWTLSSSAIAKGLTMPASIAQTSAASVSAGDSEDPRGPR